MSRSYKHTPYRGMQKSKFYKKYFNKQIRRNKNYDEDYENFQYGQYKKKTDAWKIWDWAVIGTTNFDKYYEHQLQLHEEFKRRFPSSYDEKPPTRKECWKEWRLMYFRK